MNDTQYLQYCRNLWQQFSDTLNKRCASLDDEHPLRLLATEFARLADDQEDLYRDGPDLIMRLFSHHPEFAPTLPRTLLWFLGGDCLHVLTEEEIAVFQQLDDERQAFATKGETFDYGSAAAARLPFAQVPQQKSGQNY
ncbi:hypothetical protein CWI75_07790 [Kineobactrum sediminis]|uniref:Dehydrogenase n=1 Tax=Kineobactrum sediminis TaxID=1905677 RepID=A0A2N5Y4J3_9GAMM|nr:PA2817 family protein [Kineobactrum sediminis]PLW83292.1 hypothetical protein CWI75_07790 [Kineobactrum sediminis]